MAILGMGPADYEKYTNNVREEYAFLNDETYKELRVKVCYNKKCNAIN
jgi:predicted metal-dependent HD superfamily phosphohydrolase